MTILAQLSDPHIRLDGEEAAARATLEAAVREVGRLDPAPDAVLLSGDLTDTGDPAEYAILRELLKPLAMPVHPLPGNHDDPGRLREAFADHPDVAATTGAVHYAVDVGELRVLVLDTWAAGTDGGTLDAGQLEWLDAALAHAEHDRTILALHHPPLAIGIGALDTISLDEGALAALEEVLRRRGGVARIVAGHVHRTTLGTFAGCPVLAASSIAFQSALDLRSGDRGFARADPPEPAAIALHVLAPGLPLVTHVHPVTA